VIASGGNSCEACLPPGGAFTVNSECATECLPGRILEFWCRANGRRMRVAAKRIWGFRGWSNFIDVYKKKVIR